MRGAPKNGPIGFIVLKNICANSGVDSLPPSPRKVFTDGQNVR